MPRVELRNYKAASSPMETLFRLFKYFRHCTPILIAAVTSIFVYAVATEEKGKTNKIKGIGANNGIVTGTARVIESFEEIDRLQEGDILVTKFTDTGWTPKFAILSGIVTEYGGILCHAAIVSREYGIPAIVCCKDALTKIKDGQTITINGRVRRF